MSGVSDKLRACPLWPGLAPPGRDPSRFALRSVDGGFEDEGIGYLTLSDMLELMGAEIDLCDETDRAMARRDLRANGYDERYIALWGRRRIFKRWVIVGRDREWCRQNLPGGEMTPFRPFMA